ncbi:MAG: lysophospholipid acyltransferase family protein [Prevotella sp.]
MLKILYRTYQVLILLPVLVLSTAIICSLITIVCTLAPRKWSIPFVNVMSHAWGRIIICTSLLPVTIKGKENLLEGQSCIIVANHESSYDIFLLIGYLDMTMRWMMKASLMKIPFLGSACHAAGFIPVDTSTPHKVQETYEHALKTIVDGVSLMVFPEGRRSWNGKLGKFRRGAFMIADKLQLPVIPVTIDGAYEVMPRKRDFHFITWHRLSITIHKPIYHKGEGHENIEYLMTESRKAIESAG